MMGIGAEDRELGQNIGLLAASCWQWGTVWGEIFTLLWRPGGGPHSSPVDGFGEVDIPGDTTG
jgi:hypothetical protein